jgi:hypothetical protein
MSTKPLCNFTRIGSRYTCLACGHVTLPLSEPPKRHCRMNGKPTHVLPAIRHHVADDKCIHRGGLLGELECGCCGKPAVLACAIHGRCVRHGVGKPTPIKFVPLVGEIERLTRDQMPNICAMCVDRTTAKNP